MSAISLQASVRTCDVNTGEASRIQSDRFFNPQNMVCPVWSGINNKGQEVCPDSFYTKSAGCNSAEDRVYVENALRPKYMNYVTLGSQGISGHIYGNEDAYEQSVARSKFLHDKEVNNPNFGLQFGADVNYMGCSVGAYEAAMRQMSQQERYQNSLQNGYATYAAKGRAG